MMDNINTGMNIPDRYDGNFILNLFLMNSQNSKNFMLPLAIIQYQVC